MHHTTTITTHQNNTQVLKPPTYCHVRPANEEELQVGAKRLAVREACPDVTASFLEASNADPSLLTTGRAGEDGADDHDGSPRSDSYVLKCLGLSHQIRALGDGDAHRLLCMWSDLVQLGGHVPGTPIEDKNWRAGVCALDDHRAEDLLEGACEALLLQAVDARRNLGHYSNYKELSGGLEFGIIDDKTIKKQYGPALARCVLPLARIRRLQRLLKDGKLETGLASLVGHLPPLHPDVERAVDALVDAAVLMLSGGGDAGVDPDFEPYCPRLTLAKKVYDLMVVVIKESRVFIFSCLFIYLFFF